MSELTERIDATQAILSKAMVDVANGQTVEELNAIMEQCLKDTMALWPEDEVE